MKKLLMLAVAFVFVTVLQANSVDVVWDSSKIISVDEVPLNGWVWVEEDDDYDADMPSSSKSTPPHINNSGEGGDSFPSALIVSDASEVGMYPITGTVYFTYVGDVPDEPDDDVDYDSTGIIYKLETETIATTPTDRTRKTIGVGEEVKLTCTGPSPIVWKLTGKDNIDKTSGETIKFTAGDRAATPKVKITYEGEEVTTVVLTVIEPSGVMIEQKSGTNIWHKKGTPSIGFKGQAYILPASVSFHHIIVQEQSVVGVGTGCYEKVTNTHPQGEWASIGNLVIGKGSKDKATDTIWWDDIGGAPYDNGTFTWSIPWHFKVGTSGEGKKFTTVDHVETLDSTGKATISKGGTTKSAELNDLNSSY